MKLDQIGVIISFLLLISCDRKSTEGDLLNIDPYFGYADLLLGFDSLDFKPYARSSSDHIDRFSLNLFHFSPTSILRGQLGFSNIPLYKGIHEITGGIVYGSSEIGASYFVWEGDGDIGGDIFDCKTVLGQNFINISVLDTISFEVRGNFVLDVIRTDTSFVSNPELADTFRISGTFLTILDYK